MITIYNTLTRKKEEFKPIKKNRVGMYVCGPTVYDVPHIGHARSAYVFDIIRRYFEHSGFKVSFVRNVTDIDDKIINKAVSELTESGEEASPDSLKKKTREVSVRYLDVYHRQLDALGILPPTAEPKATENIKEMINFIKVLIKKDYAYVSGGSVYFSVEKFAYYGKLSNQNSEEILHGVRIEVDDKKKYPLDFALWKEVKPDEPSWKSPWGAGRPGWHIECSVMSTRILGKQFDIHGGGLDLIFPHHENEIAQSEAATGKPFANYWIHNGLLSIKDEKMSKSLKNYVTIEDFLKKYQDPDLLRIAILFSHYRSSMDYSDERMDEIKSAKDRISIFFGKVDRAAIGEKPNSEERHQAESNAKRIKEEFEKAMDDDFNTPIAMSKIFEAVYEGNVWLVKGKISLAKMYKEHVLEFLDIFGLSFNPTKVKVDEAERVEGLIAERDEAKKQKDYARADKIREELKTDGIIIEDTPEGEDTEWRKS